MNTDMQLGMIIGMLTIYTIHGLGHFIFYLGKRSAEKKYLKKLRQEK